MLGNLWVWELDWICFVLSVRNACLYLSSILYTMYCLQYPALGCCCQQSSYGLHEYAKRMTSTNKKGQRWRKKRKKKKCCYAAYILGHNAELDSKKHPNLKALSEFLLLLAGYLPRISVTKVQKKIPPRNLFSLPGSCLMSTFLPRCQQSIAAET